MPREVMEWIGATDSTKVPPRVRLRVLLANDRKCYLSGRKIKPGDIWEAEHVRAIILGGENREGNLKPALKEPHKEKSRAEKAIKAKADAQAKSAYGIKQPKAKIPQRPSAPKREPKPSLSPRQLYR